MTDPEHLHDLTDEEWLCLETLDRLGDGYVDPVVRTALYWKGLNMGCLGAVSPYGRAHLDKVEELAQLCSQDKIDGFAERIDICEVDGFEWMQERGLVDEYCEPQPLARAVLRAYERGQNG